MSYNLLLKRIEALKERSKADSPQIIQALHRIGSVLKAEMRLNIVRQKAVDLGGLLNSIQYSIDVKDGQTILSVGSFGIPYAAINEFGGPMTRQQVGAMFASLRDRNKSIKAGHRLGKGVVTVNSDKTGFFRARPYIRPAFEKHQNFIIQMIRSAAKSES